MSDVVEPVNFEEFVEVHSDIVNRDSLRELITIPSDDIEVCLMQRKIRTTKPILPDYADFNDQSDLYINDCIRNYTCNFVVVVKKYEIRLSNAERKQQRMVLAKSLPRPEFEVDSCDESNPRCSVYSSMSELSLCEQNSDSSSCDEKTPNAILIPSSSHESTSTLKNLSFTSRTNESAVQHLNNNNNNNDKQVRPPLASDEETSEGSLTPPSKKQTNGLTDGDQTILCEASCEVSSRKSWLFIDSSATLNDPFRSSRLSVISHNSRCSRIFDLEKSESDPILVNLLKVSDDPNGDQANPVTSDVRHPHLFALYGQDDDDTFIEARPVVNAPREQLAHRILVRCLSMQLDMEVEPFFASMALYDAKERKKLSENFYFDMNSEQMKRMLSPHIPYQDVSTLSRACIFNITYPTSDMYLVIRIEKVLQGDVADSIDPYLNKDDKSRDRLRANAFLCCEKLGRYRQPFAWTAVCLTDIFAGSVANTMNGSTETIDSNNDVGSLDRRSSGSSTYDTMKRLGDTLSRKGSLERPRQETRRSLTQDELVHAITTFPAVTLTINSLFKQENERLKDDDLFKSLNELKSLKSSAVKRLKGIPCDVRLEVSPCKEQPKYSLTPELMRIAPYPEPADKRPTKELLEFPLRDVLTPHHLFRNLLFVYPKSLNFVNRPGSARNITCKVQLMSGEDDYSVLTSIFGKSGCPEFLSESFTSVVYHNKCPDFSDEIKMKLPTKLTDQHHVLFTFYHIKTKTKQNEPQSTESPIGWTWLPLYRDGRLQTGTFTLPVMMEKLPTSYSFLTPSVQIPNTKWVDNHKEIFTVVIEAHSSVHAQDSSLDAFLKLASSIEEQNIPIKFHNNIESEFKSSISSVSNSQIETLVKFFPLVMNKLVRLLVRPPLVGLTQQLNIGQTVFEAMAAIVSKISKISDPLKTSVLLTYSHYQCLFPHPEIVTPANGSGEPSSAAHVRSSSIPNIRDTVSEKNFRVPGRSPPPHRRHYPNRSSPNDVGFPSCKLFHEEMLLQFVVANGDARELALTNASFFFDLVIKSASESLKLSGASALPRRERFSLQFQDDIVTLVNGISNELVIRINRDSKDMEMIQKLNASVSFFIRDLFSLLEVSFVFSLIRKFFKHMSRNCIRSSDSIANQLFCLKIDFLRIVCGHEHYFALNLPFNCPLFPSSSPIARSNSIGNLHDDIFSPLNIRVNPFSDLSEDYRKQHYLSGLILTTLVSALDVPSAIVQDKAVALMKNVIAYHDWDPRCAKPGVRSKFAALYLPFIGIVIDSFPLLFDPESSGFSTRSGTLRKSFNSKIQPPGNRLAGGAVSPIDPVVAGAIAGHTAFEVTVAEPECRYPLREESTKDLLLCFLWLLKNAPSELLRQLWREYSIHHLTQLVEVLQLSVSMFQYKGKKTVNNLGKGTLKKNSELKSKLEEAIMGHGSARRELMLRRKDRHPASQSFSVGDSGNFRWKKDNIQNIRYTQMKGKTKEEIETELVLSGHLSTEISMIVLDTVNCIITSVCGEAQTTNLSCDNLKRVQNLLRAILQLEIRTSSMNQSTLSLQHIFAFQRSLVSRFPALIFEEKLELSAELSMQLLQNCASSLSAVRSQAAASLYFLLRDNFTNTSNFAKLKMQITMSLSSLVGLNQKFDEQHLRRSLKTILVYAENDPEHPAEFRIELQEMIFQLHMIVSDTIRMKEYQEDPDMLLDLMYRVAKGYQHSPDLRVTWLHNMAQKHTERGNHTEAAQCFVHAAATVAGYLHVLHNMPYLPISCVAFQKISANILEESVRSTDVTADRDGTCTGKPFSESGLVTLLEKAAASFYSAQLFEIVNEVYKLLIPIAEAKRQFSRLAHIHGQLQDVFNKVDELQGRRVFETYFRVGFYGPKLGDLDGEEFIYKEPYLSKLNEIAHRLESFYTAQFGAKSVEVIKDSNPVDTQQLDPGKVYIQITYVEPYFDSWELDQRKTSFERNYNIKKFVFSTPFTLEGRAHGDLHEQHKRKTILETVNTFPYVKTRIQVKNRKIISLTPIEVAIDDVQKKTAELASVMCQASCDPKILQMLLQGCIGTTVNQGPLEVANVFLADHSVTATARTSTPLQNKLKSCFKDFCRVCGEALRRNRKFIGPDQKEYQKELERNFHKFTERLAPMINNSSSSTLTSLRETFWSNEGVDNATTRSNHME